MRLATPIFDHANLYHFQSPFNLQELVPPYKKSFISIISFMRSSQFYSPDTRSAIPIFDHPQLLNFVNLYQCVKNEAASSICSGEILDLKILRSD